MTNQEPHHPGHPDRRTVRARRARHSGRRARTTASALWLTFVGALIPGSGYLLAGRRRLGVLVLTLVAALAGGGAFVALTRRDDVVKLALDPQRLLAAAVVLVVAALAWIVVVVSQHRMLRPADGGPGARVAGSMFVGVLCFAIAAPLAFAAQAALTQRSLIESIFGSGDESATRPSVDAKNPWANKPRVNILLLGADDGVGRVGVRTDSVIVASIDTKTGATALISMPRKLMFMPFPADSPLHDAYPDGFGKEHLSLEARLEWMLDAMYENIPRDNPGIFPTSANRGADVLKVSVGEATGLPIDYYVQVNLKGFAALVDALGGITVNINYPIPVGGSDDAGVPPSRYLQPGPNQHLGGHDALWFARGRYKLPNPDDRRQARQRCAIKAIADKADPATMVTKYQAIAAASKNLVRTDIPQDLLPAFVELGLKVKSARVVAVPLDGHKLRFAYPHPDYEGLRAVIAKALSPAKSPRPSMSPSTAPRPTPTHTEDLQDACGYHPEKG